MYVEVVRSGGELVWKQEEMLTLVFLSLLSCDTL